MKELDISTVVIHLDVYVYDWPKLLENLVKLVLIQQVVDFLVSLVRFTFTISTVIVLVNRYFDL